jgi:hypothetical protein
MTNDNPQQYSAFDGHQLFAQGSLEEVVLEVKRRTRAAPESRILVFSDSTGKEMDFDLSGSEKEVLQRLKIYTSAEPVSLASPGPGRPRLGVVAREVSLLPRHWEWLSTQSGGASAAIRRLVEDARKNTGDRELVKKAQERAHKFMTGIAGDLPGFEEALRALYSRNRKKFKEQISAWPSDVKTHALRMAGPALGD